MINQYKRDLTKAERRLVIRVLLVAVAVAFFWLVFAPERGLIHYHRLQKRIDTLASENQELAERNAELEKEIDRLQNDDAYLEELARHKFGLLKENETVYEVK